MKSQIFAAAMLSAVFSSVLPAADPRLLSLAMPDATVLAGVNVDQAKATPFGQYVLTTLLQTQDQKLQQLATLTGFDPRRDVHELLLASTSAPGSKTGLALARGVFDPDKIAAAAQSAGAAVETYGGFHAGGGGRLGQRQGRHRPPPRRAHHLRQASRSSEPVELHPGRLGHLHRAALQGLLDFTIARRQ